ncbi:hypothetical protein GCM10007938_30090 [Vibrio zhanjiangensis]|uniref:Uncharacterized protein n=1 Tax=Vibrio zhanjiangensis TaxID=1046128 RepID=A0ABQ6F3G3_9VIBR|nr:hypothetical protein GCM10007938_30090 [Vibrio zhanjiangensis]
MASSSEPKAILAYLVLIAPSIMKPKVELHKPSANRIGVEKSNSIEKEAIAKQASVIKVDFTRPITVSSVSDSAAAMTPNIRGITWVLSEWYQLKLTTPTSAIRISIP